MSPQTTGLEWPRPGIGVFQRTDWFLATSQVDRRGCRRRCRRRECRGTAASPCRAAVRGAGHALDQPSSERRRPDAAAGSDHGHRFNIPHLRGEATVRDLRAAGELVQRALLGGHLESLRSDHLRSSRCTSACERSLRRSAETLHVAPNLLPAARRSVWRAAASRILGPTACGSRFSTLLALQSRRPALGHPASRVARVEPSARASLSRCSCSCSRPSASCTRGPADAICSMRRAGRALPRGAPA